MNTGNFVPIKCMSYSLLLSCSDVMKKSMKHVYQSQREEVLERSHKVDEMLACRSK